MKLGRDEKHTSLIRLGRALNHPARLYIFVALLLFCAWGSAWAVCGENSYSLGNTAYGECKNFNTGENGAWDAGAFTAECQARYMECPLTVQYSGGYFVIADYNENRCTSTITGCGRLMKVNGHSIYLA